MLQEKLKKKKSVIVPDTSETQNRIYLTSSCVIWDFFGMSGPV
jgi:hypothetical protein